MTLQTFRLIFLTALTALILSPLVGRVAARSGLMDIPGSLPHKRHDKPVPLAGGWVLVIAILGVGYLSGVIQQSPIGSILFASGLVFLFGVWDDLRGLSAPVKLIGQGGAAILLIQQGVTVRLFNPSLTWLNLALTVLWLVGITNAYNFVDSMDGLANGLAAIAAGFFTIATFESGQISLSLFSATLVGAGLGTYFLNTQPARIFLGDSGAQWLGFTLAAIAIAYNPQGFLRSQSWFLPILLVGVPIFDTSLVVFSRIRRKKPIYRADFDHTYHRLVALGMSPNRAIVLMQLTALLLGCLAFIALSFVPLWANLLFGLCLLSGLVLALWLASRPLE